MAWVKAVETSRKRKGKAVKSYVVAWKSPARDEFGLPIPVNAARPEGRKKQVQHQESYATREAAEARRDELNSARHTTGTDGLAAQRKAGDLPFGYYAQAWLESLDVKVAQGRLKQRTRDDYEKLLRRYVLGKFGGHAIAGIAPRDCEQFLAGLVHQPSRQGASAQTGNRLSPDTVKHAWSVFRRVMTYALRQNAIQSNPTERVDFATNRATGDHDKFEHHPLTATHVAELSRAIAGHIDELPAYPVYGLMVEFLAYSGLRASENTGLEVGDLAFTTGPVVGATGTGTRCAVNVRRSKVRKNGTWVATTPKSRRSRRTVPLPSWLAEKLRVYLAETHPSADDPTAPLWPSRKNGGGHRVEGTRYAVPLDWSEPLAMGSFYDTIMKPPLEAIGLPASRPAVPATDTEAARPAVKGVRLHDLRHTMATMQLMAGTHFMQVSKWLGHGSFTLTLDTYGDWIPEEDGGAVNTLPEPPTVTARPAPSSEPSNVVQLFGR